MLGISHQTLRTHYKPELRNGVEKVRAAIGMSLVKAALGGNVHAQKYWLQTRGGPDWRVIEGREIGMPPLEEAPVLKIVAVKPIYAEDGSVIPRPIDRPSED